MTARASFAAPPNGEASTLRATPLVGRQTEIALLEAALKAAAAGSGGVTLLCGQPGIGKTRLLSEAARLAEGLGFTVVTGNCHRAEGALPYRPWIEALNHLVAETNGNALAGLTPAAAADLATLVPELGSGLPDAGAPAGGDRLRLFDTVAGVLLGAAKRRPVALLLEDLHWADASSAQLLGHLSRRLASSRMVVIGTYRDRDIGPLHPLGEVLAEFSERRTAKRIDIPGLSHGEALQMISLHTGQPAVAISSRFVSGLLSATDGNPYFIEEVLRHFSATGGVFSPDGALLSDVDPFTRMSVPRDLRHVLAQRIERLSTETVGVLQAAAVLGRPFEFETLREMTGLSEQVLLQALEGAMAGHLIVDLRERPGRFDFEHALVQRALTESLVTPRRQRMHLYAARALESSRAAGVPASAAVMAMHHRAAGPYAEAGDIRRHGLEAVAAALRVYAAEEARIEFEATYESLAIRGATSLDLARFVDDALASVFNLLDLAPTRVHELASQAVEAFVQAGDREAAARMKMVQAYSYELEDHYELNNPELALALIEEVEALTTDAHLLGRCAAHKPVILIELARYEEADALAMNLLHHRLPGMRASGRLRHGSAVACLGRVTESIASFEAGWKESVEIAGKAPGAGVTGHNAAAFSFFSHFWHFRNPAAAMRLIEMERPLHRQTPRIDREWDLCEAAAARERGGPFEERARTTEVQGLGDPFLGLWLQLRFRSGAWDEAISLLESMDARANPTTLDRRATVGEQLGEMLRVAGRLAEAETLLRECFPPNIPVYAVHGHAGRGLIAAETCRWDELRQQARLARDWMTNDDWLGLGARVELVEALAALGSGEREAGLSTFEAATANMRRVEHPWDEAEAHYLFGKVFRDLDEPVEAAQHFHQALSIFGRIVASRPFFERVLAAWPPSIPRPGPATPGSAPGALPAGGLSMRELEVLRLLAGGRSNAEIASALVLSRATVATHVRHILDKTATANRTEAAAWAVRGGLT